MARGRFISKAISLDEKVDALSDDTCRLLFTWLIAHLDCEGRMFGDPQTVKSIVFPRRKILIQRVEKYLAELELRGLICRYSVNGNQYLWMPNFEKHQVGLRKTQEAQSQIPPFTTDLQRDNLVITPTQVKVKVEDKVQVKVEDRDTPLIPPVSPINKETEEILNITTPSLESVIEAFRENIFEPNEDIENEINLALIRFSADWVVDAIKEACAANKRSWFYIAGILKNWEKYGKGAKFPAKEAQ